MIHYHGGPITPQVAARRVYAGGHAFISIAAPQDLGVALEVCQSFAVDNGAFPAWRSGKPVTNWSRFYEWVAELHRYPSFDFAVIPDVIDGGEEENDALIAEWPWHSLKDKWIGAPVWHMHESLDRLLRLSLEWPRVCIGSSGEFATVGNAAWWMRMHQAMHVVCDRNGNPICKLHGLRMLNTRVFSQLPLSSADSTNIARNIGIDSAWKGTYTPPTKEVRAVVMRERIEAFNSTTFYDRAAGLI